MAANFSHIIRQAACVLAISWLAQPAFGQLTRAMWELCRDGPGDAAIFGACTAVIESGLLQPQELVFALEQRGVAAFRAQRYAEAMQDFEQAIALAPNRGVLHRHLGLARGNRVRGGGDGLAQHTSLERALLDFDRALKLDPKDAMALVLRGDAYVAMGRIERGFDDLSQAVALDPKLPEAWNSRGLAWLARGAFTQAVADLDEAIRLRPDYANAFLHRGLSHDALDEADKAIADFTEVIRLDRSSAKAYNNRGMRYAKQLKFDLAIDDLEYATRLDPAYASPVFNLAQIYYQRGDKARALANYIQARQLDRRYPEPPEDIYEGYDIDIPGSSGPRRPFSQ